MPKFRRPYITTKDTKPAFRIELQGKDIVVLMPPKSRRVVKLQVTEVRRAEPRVVFDPPED